MTVHLKSREYYEERYDRSTVKFGRHDTKFFEKMYEEFFRLMPDEPPNSPRAVLHLNLIYVVFVGNNLLDRYDKREADIRDMMAKDEAKDQKLANAHLMVEPVCRHCRASGLRIIDKMLCHRVSFDEPEEVLFTLKCPVCEKGSAVWQDAKPLEPKPTLCPKCQTAMTCRDKRKGKIITTTYSCPSCKHEFKDELDLTPKVETPDPDFEADRAIYCLQDEKAREELRNARWRYEQMAKLGKEFKEKKENEHIYEAIAQLKRPKISELTTLISPVITEAGYTEFILDKPEMGKYVQVGFSCLDSSAKRNDYDSKKMLAKHIQKALEDTNWRLMSNDITCRLGCLSGRLKAYENEDDLRRLIVRQMEKRSPSRAVGDSQAIMEGKQGDAIIF